LHRGRQSKREPERLRDHLRHGHAFRVADHDHDDNHDHHDDHDCGRRLPRVE
jgi:hypothetical protein